MNTPTKRATPSPPVSPSKGPRYIPLQEHQFECPDCSLPTSPTLNGNFHLRMTGEVCPVNSAIPRPSPRVTRGRRPAPSPPTPRRQRPSASRSQPYAHQSFHPRDRPLTPFIGPLVSEGETCLKDFIPTLERTYPLASTSIPSPPGTRTPSPPRTTPSPDIFLEFYTHTRHPLGLRTHLTILPCWALKAKKKSRVECVICYGQD